MADEEALAQIRAAFQVFDVDGSGKLSADEMRAVLSRGEDPMCSAEDIEEIISEFDKNGDGELSIEEFSRAFLSLSYAEYTALQAKIDEAAAPVNHDSFSFNRKEPEPPMWNHEDHSFNRREPEPPKLNHTAESFFRGHRSEATGPDTWKTRFTTTGYTMHGVPADESFLRGPGNIDFGGKVFLSDNASYGTFSADFDQMDVEFAETWRQPPDWDDMSDMMKTRFFDDRDAALGRLAEQKEATWQSSPDYENHLKQRMDGDSDDD